MKKYPVIIIALLCLCACSSVNPNGILNTDEDNSNTNIIIPESSTDSRDYADTPAPDYIYPLHYDSLLDFDSSIKKENEEKFYAIFSEKVKEEKLDELKLFVAKLQSKKIIVPCLSGKVVDFRNKEGFSNISLFASESYGLPWIFYYPNVSTEENFYIKITFLPDSVLEKQKNPTASDVIKELSPNSPNVNNLGEQHKNIYNQELKLSDREVTALIYEYKTDNRNSTIFIYDDLLVEIRSNPEVWSTQWFSALSFDCFDE